MEEATGKLREALDIFSDNLTEIRDALVENMAFDIEHLTPPQNNWVSEGVYVLRVDACVKKRRMVVNRINARLSPKRHLGGITDGDIARAKEYPVADLLDGVRHGMVQCPFHDDRTASMSVRRHNRYHCFGCGEKGDVIDLYMKINGVSFIQAVKKLI